MKVHVQAWMSRSEQKTKSYPSIILYPISSRVCCVRCDTISVQICSCRIIHTRHTRHIHRDTPHIRRHTRMSTEQYHYNGTVDGIVCLQYSCDSLIQRGWVLYTALASKRSMHETVPIIGTVSSSSEGNKEGLTSDKGNFERNLRMTFLKKKHDM